MMLIDIGDGLGVAVRSCVFSARNRQCRNSATGCRNWIIAFRAFALIGAALLTAPVVFSPTASWAVDAGGVATTSDRGSGLENDGLTDPVPPSTNNDVQYDESAIGGLKPNQSDNGDSTTNSSSEKSFNDAGVFSGSLSASVQSETADVQQDGDDLGGPSASVDPAIEVEAHVQDLGWRPAVSSGAIAGTTGKNLRLEALRIALRNFPEGSGINVVTHVAELGWQSAVGQGAVAGTEGRDLAIQALSIELTGPVADQFDIWYRLHVQDFGWLGWARNGERAGTSGYGKSAEAVEIILLPKGSPVPGATDNAYMSPSISYRAHVEDIGWQTSVLDGQLAGTTGKALGMQALTVSLGPDMPQGSVEARAHVAEIGWQPWTANTCGTTGRSLAMEAIELRLTGDAAASYDIWYRVHVSDLGWLGWAKNGDPAGTAGESLDLQAVEVRIADKGAEAPGTQGDAYIGDFESISANGVLIDNTSLGMACADTVTVGNVNSTVPLRSIGVSLEDAVRAGSISYRTQAVDGGWQASVATDGAQTNGENDGLPITAVELTISGDVQAIYDLWYRVSLVGTGWLGWAPAGAQAGTDDASRPVNAIELALVQKGEPAPGSTGNAYLTGEAKAPAIRYQAHVAEQGWQGFVDDGEVAGTTGESLALEALRVGLDGADEGSGVRVSAHVAETGWMDFVQTPAFGGTVGETKAAQAFKIELVGGIASTHDIYYRVHAAGYGWLGWAKNGEIAGTTGLSRNAEAIEIKLIQKGTEVPVSDVPAALALPEITFNLHVQDRGWLQSVGNGSINGTMGQSLRVEGLTISANSPIDGGVSYSAHVEDIGWQPTVTQGALAGTEGQSKRIEAVKINLTGDLSRYFDIWYRAYVQDYGWLGWTKNGQAAGTGNISYRMEALQIRVTAKDAPAPGATYRPYTEEPAMSAAQRDMIARAQGYASRTSWMLMVDTTNCYVGIFTGGQGHWSQWGYWLCSVGAYRSPTPRGEYTVQAKGYAFGHGYTCYYYTQFWGDYLFHTIKYNPGTFVVQDGRLGMHISEGCVRLPLEQAKWIYDNIPAGTKVVIY